MSRIRDNALRVTAALVVLASFCGYVVATASRLMLAGVFLWAVFGLPGLDLLPAAFEVTTADDFKLFVQRLALTALILGFLVEVIAGVVSMKTGYRVWQYAYAKPASNEVHAEQATMGPAPTAKKPDALKSGTNGQPKSEGNGE